MAEDEKNKEADNSAAQPESPTVNIDGESHRVSDMNEKSRNIVNFLRRLDRDIQEHRFSLDRDMLARKQALLDLKGAIKEKEFTKCKNNGITPVEFKIGYDGIVMANSKKGPRFSLTTKQVFLALAKLIPVDGVLVKNPYKK